MRIVYYLNQFFGQVGGEDKAGMEPMLSESLIGPGIKLQDLLGADNQIVGTIICGDNYFNENTEVALNRILTMIKDLNPDMLIAGPAFNAGRYGVACGELCKAVGKELNIPTVSGMYVENPGAEVCKGDTFIALTGNSAATMRDALPKMANLAKKLLSNTPLELPEIDNYIPQGRRKTVIMEKRGSERAVDMLLDRLNNREFKTELPMPVFDQVEIAQPIANMATARIALITTGGIVPNGNPDKIQSASAQKWGKYDVKALDKLGSDYYTIHGGYDPVYANESPDRIVPLDLLKEYAKEGLIGDVYEYFYTTTGTGTSVGNAIKFGQEIGQELKNAQIDGAILTST
ncbi:glycine reductase [Cetobacterium ceti]|uniref:Glycine reductase n=3 Tax=Cetobacterium ceti TaxID=180163 RepID=A0A1T4NWN0_9FUSO|nr:glycine reductase [Cetobacterium ceti]